MTDIVSKLDKLGLSEADRYDFQSRRYSNANMFTIAVKSGKIILTDALRDPVQVITSLEQLRTLLREESEAVTKRYWRESQAKRDAIRADEEEEDELASLEIDL